MRTIFRPLLAALTLFTGWASAAEIHVPSAVPSLELAIAQAVDGDVIVLQPGTYEADSITISGKSITIRGEGALPSQTTISGVLILGHDWGAALVVSGASSFGLENVRVIGAEGYAGPPPARCNGGEGGDGLPAVSLSAVGSVTMENVELMGGLGGWGLPNTGSCPAGGTRGNGAPGLVVDLGTTAAITGGKIEGGGGTVVGPAITLNNGSYVLGQGVGLDVDSTPWTASEILLLDGASEAHGFGLLAAEGWSNYL